MIELLETICDWLVACAVIVVLAATHWAVEV